MMNMRVAQLGLEAHVAADRRDRPVHVQRQGGRRRLAGARPRTRSSVRIIRTCSPSSSSSWAIVSSRAARGSERVDRGARTRGAGGRPATHALTTCSAASWIGAPRAHQGERLFDEPHARPRCRRRGTGRTRARRPPRHARSGAPVVATLRAASVEGGVTPWSIDDTSTAANSLPHRRRRQFAAEDQVDRLGERESGPSARPPGSRGSRSCSARSA